MQEMAHLAFHFARARWAFTHLRGTTLAAYQNRRARKIIRFAARHSPFYRAHWQNADLARWGALPTVNKAAMMAHFGEFNTQGISRDDALNTALRAEKSRDFVPSVGNRITVGLSSGTSGHRGLFLVSQQETAAWAGTILARTLPLVPPRGYRVALFLRSNSNLYERLGASRRVVFRWFDLMTAPADAITALNDYAPHLLVGPPSLLLLLADAARKGNLSARPKQILSVAEVLEPQDKARLEETFSVPVGQIYQCTEGLLAVTCSHHQLHVQEDLVALDYAPLSPNDPLHVTPIVTDLWRRTQPIIRYRLNDVLRLSPPDTPPCPCGSAFQRLDAIEGRRDDVCWFPSGNNTLRPFFPDAIRQMVLLADVPITDYAAVQEKPGHLRFYLDTDAASFDRAAAAVRISASRAVFRYQCLPAVIEVERGIPVTVPGEKRRRVRCLHKV